MRALQAERNLIDKEWQVTLREVVQRAIDDAQKKSLGGVVAQAAVRRTGVNRKRRY
jgi:hypothetical protein